MTDDDARRENLKKLTAWDTLPDELQKESDRGLVFLAAAALDVRLREVLAAFMIAENQAVDRLLGTDEEPTAPLAGFPARISVAYCLGLISLEQRNDLVIVQRIRDRFASLTHVCDFEDDLVRNWCWQLRTPEMLGTLTTAREQFMIAYMLSLEIELGIAIDRARRARRVRPADLWG